MKKLFFILSIASIFGCSNSNVTIERYGINEESYKWINHYDTQDEVIVYHNGADSTTVLVVSREAREDEPPFYLACLEEDPFASCRYDVAVLEFPAGANTVSDIMRIALAIFGRDDLRIMPTGAGTAVNMGAKYNESMQSIETMQPDKFTATYQSNYSYQGEEVQAITLVTDSTEDFFMGGLFPPKRIVVVKGIGIVEWDDYNGNNWFLLE